MSKTKKILMLTNLFIVSLLIVNIVTSQAAVPSWGPGDIYLWGRQTIDNSEIYFVQEDKSSREESIDRSDVEYNITAIDTVQKEFDAFRTAPSGITFINDREYDAQEFVNDYLDDLDTFMDINYVWDYEHNRSVCNNFGINLGVGMYYLIEPDWKVINNGFKDVLNGSEIIDTLNDPYSSTIFNYTLNDFLGNITVKIMGKGSLASGLTQFVEGKTKWTLEFDLSNYIMEGNWNGTMNIYTPYDIYTETWEIEYEAGGVLNNFKYTLTTKISYEDFIFSSYNEDKTTLGGIKAVAADFSTIAAVAGIIFTSAMVLIIKRRKK